MKGFITNIEKATQENNDFRRVLYTASHSQLVVMSIPVGGDIGEEMHDLDQFIRVESGSGKAVLNGEETAIGAEDAVIIPQGVRHNILNTGNEPLKVYSVYSPPQHRDKVVHPTKADAEADSEHFDGQATEK